MGIENGTWVCWKIFSGPYSNYTYLFSTHAGLCKVVMRVTIFVVSPIIINALIGFKEISQVL